MSVSCRLHEKAALKGTAREYEGACTGREGSKKEQRGSVGEQVVWAYSGTLYYIERSTLEPRVVILNPASITYIVFEEVNKTGQRRSLIHTARSLLLIVVVYIVLQEFPFFHQWSSKRSSCTIYAILTMVFSSHSHVLELLPCVPITWATPTPVEALAAQFRALV